MSREQKLKELPRFVTLPFTRINFHIAAPHAEVAEGVYPQLITGMHLHIG